MDSAPGRECVPVTVATPFSFRYLFSSQSCDTRDRRCGGRTWFGGSRENMRRVYALGEMATHVRIGQIILLSRERGCGRDGEVPALNG